LAIIYGNKSCMEIELFVPKLIILHIYATLRGFQYFQVYQYFTIYRRYFLLKFKQFSWISYTTLFKIRRNQIPFKWVKVPGTAPYWKAWPRFTFFYRWVWDFLWWIQVFRLPSVSNNKCPIIKWCTKFRCFSYYS
jgi:hypothetical protein